MAKKKTEKPEAKQAGLKTIRVEHIAKVCHEANRAYCFALGDGLQKPWSEAPEWARQSAIKGVKFHLANPDSQPQDSHESWLKEKEAEGWKYGEVKNAELKEHPCFLPFEELPVEQQTKDLLFLSIVRALEGMVAPA